MNGVTREIAKLLNISLDEALKVQDYIDRNWLLDYSECTTRQFNNAVEYAYKRLSK